MITEPVLREACSGKRPDLAAFDIAPYVPVAMERTSGVPTPSNRNGALHRWPGRARQDFYTITSASGSMREAAKIQRPTSMVAATKQSPLFPTV